MNYHAIFIRHSKIDAIYPHYSLMQLTNTSGLIIVFWLLFVPSIILLFKIKGAILKSS